MATTDGQDFEEYEQLIEDCENRDHRLSPWAREFLESIKARIKRWDPLTPGQVDKLNEVWEEATSRG